MILPIGRVIYSENDARFFVFLYFIVSILSLVTSCICWRAGGVNFKMEADTDSILSIQRGAVNQNDRSAANNFGNKNTGVVGHYSGRVMKYRNWLLMLIAAGSLVDTTKMYFQAKAVEADLEKCYGSEYTLWYDVAIDQMSIEDALAANATRKMRMLSAVDGDEEDADEKTPSEKAKCMMQKWNTQMDPHFNAFKMEMKKRVEDMKDDFEKKHMESFMGNKTEKKEHEHMNGGGRLLQAHHN